MHPRAARTQEAGDGIERLDERRHRRVAAAATLDFSTSSASNHERREQQQQLLPWYHAPNSPKTQQHPQVEQQQQQREVLEEKKEKQEECSRKGTMEEQEPQQLQRVTGMQQHESSAIAKRVCEASPYLQSSSPRDIQRDMHATQQVSSLPEKQHQQQQQQQQREQEHHSTKDNAAAAEALRQQASLSEEKARCLPRGRQRELLLSFAAAKRQRAEELLQQHARESASEPAQAGKLVSATEEIFKTGSGAEKEVSLRDGQVCKANTREAVALTTGNVAPSLLTREKKGINEGITTATCGNSPSGGPVGHVGARVKIRASNNAGANLNIDRDSSLCGSKGGEDVCRNSSSNSSCMQENFRPSVEQECVGRSIINNSMKESNVNEEKSKHIDSKRGRRRSGEEATLDTPHAESKEDKARSYSKRVILVQQQVQQLRETAAQQRDRALLVRGSKQRSLLLMAEKKEREAEQLLQSLSDVVPETERDQQKEDTVIQSSNSKNRSEEVMLSQASAATKATSMEATRATGQQPGKIHGIATPDGLRFSPSSPAVVAECKGDQQYEYSSPGNINLRRSQALTEQQMRLQQHAECVSMQQQWRLQEEKTDQQQQRKVSAQQQRNVSAQHQRSVSTKHQRNTSPEQHRNSLAEIVARLRMEAAVARDKASCCSGAKAHQLRSLADLKDRQADERLRLMDSQFSRSDSVPLTCNNSPAPADHGAVTYQGRDHSTTANRGAITYQGRDHSSNDTSAAAGAAAIPPCPTAAFAVSGTMGVSERRLEAACGNFYDRAASCNNNRRSSPPITSCVSCYQNSAAGTVNALPCALPAAAEASHMPTTEAADSEADQLLRRIRLLREEATNSRQKAACVCGGRQRQLLAIAAAKERQALEIEEKITSSAVLSEEANWTPGRTHVTGGTAARTAATPGHLPMTDGAAAVKSSAGLSVTHAANANAASCLSSFASLNQHVKRGERGMCTAAAATQCHYTSLPGGNNHQQHEDQDLLQRKQQHTFLQQQQLRQQRQEQQRIYGNDDRFLEDEARKPLSQDVQNREESRGKEGDKDTMLSLQLPCFSTNSTMHALFPSDLQLLQQLQQCQQQQYHEQQQYRQQHRGACERQDQQHFGIEKFEKLEEQLTHTVRESCSKRLSEREGGASEDKAAKWHTSKDNADGAGDWAINSLQRNEEWRNVTTAEGRRGGAAAFTETDTFGQLQQRQRQLQQQLYLIEFQLMLQRQYEARQAKEQDPVFSQQQKLQTMTDSNVNKQEMQQQQQRQQQWGPLDQHQGLPLLRRWQYEETGLQQQQQDHVGRRVSQGKEGNEEILSVAIGDRKLQHYDEVQTKKQRQQQQPDGLHQDFQKKQQQQMAVVPACDQRFQRKHTDIDRSHTISSSSADGSRKADNASNSADSKDSVVSMCFHASGERSHASGGEKEQPRPLHGSNMSPRAPAAQSGNNKDHHHSTTSWAGSRSSTAASLGLESDMQIY